MIISKNIYIYVCSNPPVYTIKSLSTGHTQRRNPGTSYSKYFESNPNRKTQVERSISDVPSTASPESQNVLKQIWSRPSSMKRRRYDCSKLHLCFFGSDIFTIHILMIKGIQRVTVHIDKQKQRCSCRCFSVSKFICWTQDVLLGGGELWSCSLQ